MKMNSNIGGLIYLIAMNVFNEIFDNYIFNSNLMGCKNFTDWLMVYINMDSFLMEQEQLYSCIEESDFFQN